LTGTVSDRRTKRLAESVAESVRGVVDVHNQLRLA
jgi:osmotically-inducible protein OsmY